MAIAKVPGDGARPINQGNEKSFMFGILTKEVNGCQVFDKYFWNRDGVEFSAGDEVEYDENDTIDLEITDSSFSSPVEECVIIKKKVESTESTESIESTGKES